MITENIWQKTPNFLSQNYIPEQIVSQIWISQDKTHRHVYIDSTQGNELYRYLGRQKEPRKRYAAGKD